MTNIISNNRASILEELTGEMPEPTVIARRVDSDGVSWPYYGFTATQLREYAAGLVAKAVAAERESIADELEHGFMDDEGHHLQYAAEIRNRGNV